MYVEIILIKGQDFELTSTLLCKLLQLKYNFLVLIERVLITTFLWITKWGLLGGGVINRACTEFVGVFSCYFPWWREGGRIQTLIE